MMRFTSGALLFAAIAGCESGAAERSSLEHLAMSAEGRELPFSAAVRAGQLLFLSGQLGTDSTLQLVAGGIGPETRQAMENIRAILGRAGASMDQVVKCTVMLADIAEWAAMNEEYVRFFSGPPPARSALGASGLALGARVEIECIAMVEGS